MSANCRCHSNSIEATDECRCVSSSEWSVIDSAEKDELLCKMEDGEFW